MDLYVAALPVCLTTLRQDRELKSLEFLPTSGPLFLPDESGRPRSLFLRPDFAIGRTTMLNGNWQIQDPEFFANHIMQSRHGRSSKVVLVDIGANIGLFTRQLMALAGESLNECWCYEPDPVNFEFLQRNLIGSSSLHLIEAGLSNQAKRADLYLEPENSGNCSLYKEMIPIQSGASVEILLMSAQQQSRLWLETGFPIYYKSDTQGHDMAIASALDECFWQNVSCAMLELCPVHDGNDYEPEAFRSILEAFDSRVYADRPQELLSSDQIMSFLDAKSNIGSNKDLFLWR